MNISLDKLRYFLEVAKLEHVGLASKSLGISASAISTAISSIEIEYGHELFERSHQRIFLNEKGLWLRERLQPILEELDSLSSEIKGEESQFSGHLNVGGSYFLANHYLQPVLNELQIANPDISCEISPLRSTQVLQEVLQGILDYGVCIGAAGHPSLERQVLYSGELKIVVSKKHPVVKQIKNNTFKLKSLSDYPAAVHKYAPGINYQEAQVFQKVGIDAVIKNFYHSEELAIKSVMESQLWAVVPDFVAHHYKADLVIVPLPREWKTTFEVCSLYRTSMKGRPIFQHLDQVLKSHFEK